jgi:hypothetical protein
MISSDVGSDLEDQRTPLLRYLCDPSAKVDKKIFSGVHPNMCCMMMNRRTAKDLLLKCLGSDQVKVATGEIHEGIRGAYLAASKI